MRTEFKCVEHYQGDRCQLVDGHDQEEHIGRHSIWVLQNGRKVWKGKVIPQLVGRKKEMKQAIEILSQPVQQS